MFNSGKPLHTFEEIVSKETDILSYYFNINTLPTVICSPLRKDNNPSFSIFCVDNDKVRYKDFATRESGDIYDLIGKVKHMSLQEVLGMIYNDQNNIGVGKCKVLEYTQSNNISSNSKNNHTKLEVKTRDWRNYDIEYWSSYGISLEWLKYAEVYPISHSIITKGQKKYCINADKYAYCYVEHKEGEVTLKVYQPFNKKYKWTSRHNKSVISLWTKVPKFGNSICICSSLKDALCLWSNLGLPCIATQGEGYSISQTAINELKRRFKNIFICFDNDNAGLFDGEKLSKQTGFTNVILPSFDGGKDISDLYKIKGKKEFISIVLPLFKEKIKDN